MYLGSKGRISIDMCCMFSSHELISTYNQVFSTRFNPYASALVKYDQESNFFILFLHKASFIVDKFFVQCIYKWSKYVIKNFVGIIVLKYLSFPTIHKWSYFLKPFLSEYDLNVPNIVKGKKENKLPAFFFSLFFIL